MSYQVRFVQDSGLPEGVEWAFARTSDDTYLFVKQSAIDVSTGRCDALTRAWEAWQCVEVQARLASLSGFASVQLEEPAHAL